MCSYGLFGEDFHLQKLSELGDSLDLKSSNRKIKEALINCNLQSSKR